MRYLVLPERPEGTEGWSEADLSQLATRNAMIGVEKVKPPGNSGRNG
jgi:nitrile hydratase